MAYIVVSGGEYDGQAFEIDKEPFVIGRVANDDIYLRDESVSKEHARVITRGDDCYLQDLGSRNGTYSNGRLISQISLFEQPSFQIGPYTLCYVQREKDLQRRNEESLDELRRFFHGLLIDALDLNKLTMGQMMEPGFRDKAARELNRLLETHQDRLIGRIDIESFRKRVIDSALGMGPLEDLLFDPEVTEIMVNAPDRIFIEKDGRLVDSGRKFLSIDDVFTAIERIVGPIGRRIDESSPLVDARLPDGSRVNVIIPPLALNGPSLTIRKFPERALTIDDLLSFQTLSKPMASFLELCIKFRRNIVVSGGTGSGKTSLLNVLGAFIPNAERIVTIEDSAELQLPQDHIVRLETRPPNIEGKGEFTIRDLVRNALRMRPDRIIVGECRGGEALDMLQAMNTGHDGSLTTAHANSPPDLLRRLETMVLMAGMDLPLSAVRESVASAIHIILQIKRFSDGSRKVVSICELQDLDEGEYRIQEIFRFCKEGLTRDQRMRGYFTATGVIPSFVEELREEDVDCQMDLYVPGRESA
jgi:pilus assembly protein CpaF